MKHLLSFVAIFSLTVPAWLFSASTVRAESAGDLIKCEDFSAVYYLDGNDERWVFPNEHVYNSWFADFDSVEEIDCDELAEYSLGGLVTYQPGTRLVKMPSVPTVYAVEPGGILRAIQDEDQAEAIWGEDWASLVDDLSEAFFSSYDEWDELDENEIPEGLILEDEDESLYWMSDDGNAIQIDEIIEDGTVLVAIDYARPLEEVLDALDTDVSLLLVDDDDDDELHEPRRMFESIAPYEQEVADLLIEDFEPPEGEDEDADEDNYGPWNTRLVTAYSDDGLDFEKTYEVVSDQADVPDLVLNENGWVFLYYVGWTVGDESNLTVVAISDDAGTTWTYKYVQLEGFEDGSSPVDPDVQALDDGMFRLYVTFDPDDGDGPRTYSALSYDGIHFEMEGEAFERNGDAVLDPSTLLIGDTWHLFAGGDTEVSGANWHGTSEDGEEFDYEEEMHYTVDGNSYAFSNGIAFDDDLYRFYAFSNVGEDIRYFYSDDGDDWTLDTYRIGVGNEDVEDAFVKDPAVVELEDGRYLMVYVTHIPD